MDLLNEFIQILKQFGHPVYVQRRAEENETGPYRTVAGGRYMPTAERWTVYRWFRRASRQSQSGKLSPEGIAQDIDAVFYFQAEAAIKTSDLISEQTPNERTDRDTYRVEKAFPFYLGGQMIYIAAHCKRLDPTS